MADLFDYLIWRGDLPMDLVPPNPVDTLILSALSYLDYDGLVPGDFLHPVPLKVAAEAFLMLPDREDRDRVKRDGELLAAAEDLLRLVKSRRGMTNKDNAKLTSQIRSLIEKWK